MSKKVQIHIVWFKRDLRIHDHAPLTDAARQGVVLPLYIVEPQFWQQPDAAYRHWQFIRESLQALDSSLQQLGQCLVVRAGDAVSILTELSQNYDIRAMYSHEETGNAWTYKRDLKVADWCHASNIIWHEYPSNGVIRRLATRDKWASIRDARMADDLIKAPVSLQTIADINTEVLPDADILGLQYDGIEDMQKGGRHEAIVLLNSFLKQRGQYYTKSMSSPNSAFYACSRLSPHIVNGTLSIREITKTLEKQRDRIKQLPEKSQKSWRSALRSFESRLYWRCHFIQKLEDQPSIEYKNLHSAYDGLRENQFDKIKFAAWCQGNTGYPMVDACMRALHKTGWINFRMRAMLMSFASYHLWLHWHDTALHLARLFTDYEPGIHYSQIQMQSGTTGMNIPRMYNPVKQSQEHDPHGKFIRQYIPELANVPDSDIHEPWLIPPMLQGEYKCVIGVDYPKPIVDLKVAIAYAREQLAIARKKASYKTESQKLVKKHASRKPRSVKKKKVSRKQMQLDLDD